MAIPNQSPDNDSAHDGHLQPTEPQPGGQLPPGDTMADYVQQYIAALAGMDGHMVYQRWQAEPPNLPDYGVDWCSAGMIRRRPIGLYGATIWQNPAPRCAISLSSVHSGSASVAASQT